MGRGGCSTSRNLENSGCSRQLRQTTVPNWFCCQLFQDLLSQGREPVGEHFQRIRPRCPIGLAALWRPSPPSLMGKTCQRVCQGVFRVPLPKPSTCHDHGQSRTQPTAWGALSGGSGDTRAPHIEGESAMQIRRREPTPRPPKGGSPPQETDACNMNASNPTRVPRILILLGFHRPCWAHPCLPGMQSDAHFSPRRSNKAGTLRNATQWGASLPHFHQGMLN